MYSDETSPLSYRNKYPETYRLDQAIQHQMQMYLDGTINMNDFATAFIRLHSELQAAKEREKQGE